MKRREAMDALNLLKKQHAEVKTLFGRYDKTDQTAARQEIFEQVADALAAHSEIEEKIFYPSVYVGALKSRLEEAVEEHLAAKRVIADLLQLKPEDEQFDAKMKVLKEEIEHHVKEEESSLFPRVQKNFARAELEMMGTQMEEMFEELLKKQPRLKVPSQTDHAAPLG
jgi:hemerythrin superfamily protein